MQVFKYINVYSSKIGAAGWLLLHRKSFEQMSTKIDNKNADFKAMRNC